jgi:2-polyprenyl-3-methyl-5-hydroxy-6-metoxy-1,4-benzoquinol methylase
MIVDMMPLKVQYNILDLGAGPGIFSKELKKHALRVKSVDRLEEVDLNWRFDIVVCASYLEFVNVEQALFIINQVLNPSGLLIIASPMENILTKIYFRLCRSSVRRRSHKTIFWAISERFNILEHKKWLSLYFAIKAQKR